MDCDDALLKRAVSAVSGVRFQHYLLLLLNVRALGRLGFTLCAGP
jgi:hypothetical protein